MKAERPQSHDSVATDRRGFVGMAATGLAAATLASQPVSNVAAAEATVALREKTFRDHLLECLGGPWPEAYVVICPDALHPRVARPLSQGLVAQSAVVLA